MDVLSLLDAASAGPVSFINWLLLVPLAAFMKDVLAPLAQEMFEWGTDFMSIPYLNQIIGWLQGLAITAVIIVRVFSGIRRGLLREGADYEFSVGEYVFKSLLSILAVSVMPLICNIVISLGKSMYDYLMNATGGIGASMDWFDMDGFDVAAAEPSDLGALWLLLGMILVLVLCIACGYQFIRRQVEMIVVALISPIIAVYTATEDDANQVGDLLKSLFALVCQQWLQVVLVLIALGFGQAWVTGANGSWNAAGHAGIQNFMWCIATFMAALAMPKLLDRYTYGQSGTRIGGIVASQAIMMTMRSGWTRALR